MAQRWGFTRSFCCWVGQPNTSITAGNTSVSYTHLDVYKRQDHLITRHGAAVVTEDSISNRVQKFPTSVLNQWTYHSRLYAAAKYCTCLLYTSRCV